jgi:hypothetical protein
VKSPRDFIENKKSIPFYKDAFSAFKREWSFPLAHKSIPFLHRMKDAEGVEASKGVS